MGIEKFNTWIKNKYYNAILEYIPQQCFDHVYIDLNFMLHRLAATTHNEHILIKKVFTSIDNVFINHPPLKSLTLVADGPACYAKILLQRKRRLHIAQTTETKDIENNIGALHFTPGTSFMLKFEKEIKDYVQSKKYIDIQYHLSLSSEPNEAEIKICHYIIKNCQKNPLDTHLILSNDADIVVIASTLIYVPNIYILIQQNQGAGNYIISMDKLLDQHMEQYGFNVCKKLDFAFVSLFNGNDYFPKLGYTNFNSLWKAYEKAFDASESIVKLNGTLDVNMLKKYLYSLINVIPFHFNNKINLNTLQWKHIQKYLQGLIWCLDLYSTGECHVYDYIYSGFNIHPLAILYYLEINHITRIDTLTSTCVPIKDTIYAIIVTPKKAKNLILHKYHHLMDTKLKFLYDEENCQKCEKLRKKHGDILRKYIAMEKDDSLKETTKHLLTKCMKRQVNHKKLHEIKHPKKFINESVKIISS